jgi:mono/diheme cytochrome c family protein
MSNCDCEREEGEIMKRQITFATLVLSIMVVTGWVFPASSVPMPQAQSGKTFVAKGHKLFNQYCATCHGITGKGEGPVASALKVGPPDLTAIQQAGEKFPFYRVQTKIDGEKAVVAHGTSKMPVWGEVFKRTTNDMQKNADVFALVKYIESIQRVKM